VHFWGMFFSSFQKMTRCGQDEAISFCPLDFSGSMITIPSGLLETAPFMEGLAHGGSSQCMQGLGVNETLTFGTSPAPAPQSASRSAP